MMSLCRNLAVLLLFLIASPLPHSNLFTLATSTTAPATRPRIIFLTGIGSEDDDDDDDDDYDYEKPTVPTQVVKSVQNPLVHQAPKLCHYDFCLENQEPCDQISAKTGCLCPGVSGGDQPPHSPRIQELVPITRGGDRGKIEIRWCAPSSVVTGYKVVIEGGEVLEFEDVSRRGLVRSMEVGTNVCVEAVNGAGHSIPSDFSCMRYEHPESSDHKLLAGIIGGGVALLLVLIIAAVILWKHQMRKKAKRDSANGLGNPSYSTEGTL
ncbi:hypothetical protein JOQ06_023268 [Pogonophryne albipinna]|uniref:LRRN4 C-terminal-like protein n=1 Tax=Pogonophryne albipinna TaxID=1090488 RepID=A0AAD6FTQ0_9TELE|nr:hypothetical protein JOQ06_023268 [Pogonophryne albipinna]